MRSAVSNDILDQNTFLAAIDGPKRAPVMARMEAVATGESYNGTNTILASTKRTIRTTAEPRNVARFVAIAGGAEGDRYSRNVIMNTFFRR